MNKNRYRIIYNKARQMFMAVAENAKSQTKTSGQSTSSVATPTSEESFHQLWHVKALVASMSLWMPLSTVYAGMMADTGANAANRPVIGVGQDAQKQNVPVINIQTPNASGVSHNIYKEFDVPTQGAVLNNSRTGAPSSIVGSVAANPYLQTGEARIILNEVNSAIASKFEGNLEIAGQQADLIIANPAGINIKGGGFINANKAILTTGKPQLNADGSIKEFVVDQGKITVSANAGSNLGLGGATNNNANYIDLYTRALELNAQLYAKNDIQVITGTNTISADLNKVESKTSTATAPTVAIDVKALGGMYANNIYMVGTEKGLGVNNAGTLQAVNNLVITSAGKIEHSGLISSTSKTQGVVSITTSETGAAGDINSSGSINSNSMLNIDSANNLNVNAKDILINYGGVASSPMLINTKGNLNLAANTRIMNDSVGGDLFVDAANINLGTSSELKSNRGSATIQAQQDLTSSASARLIAAQDLNVLGKGKLSFTNTLLHASLGSINLQAGSSNTQGLIDIQAGTINAAKDLNLSSSGDINLKNLGLAAENSVSRVKNINAYSGQNLKWDNTNIALPQIAGKVQLDAANQMDLIGSTISNKDDINLQANKINLSTALTSQKNINIVSKVNDLILDKAITAQGDINVSALAGNINANSLNAVSSQGKLSVLAQKDINITSLQETTPTPSADKNKVTTKQAILKAEKGITIGSLGEGKLALKAVELTANQGTIQLLGKNGVNLEGNEDIYITGDKGQSRIINTKLTAQDILIENKKADVNLKQTDLLATTGNIAVSSEGETKLVGTNLKASGNIELSAKKNLTIQSTYAIADKHMALNAKNLMYISSELGSPYTNYIANSQTNLTAKGVLSMISGSSHVTHNANYTGGAILLEAGSFLMGLSNVQFNATGSDLLKNDAKLNSLNGDLSILQTTNDLVIDPKKQKFTALGDMDFTAKAGAVKLLGYGGTAGNGSEQIVKLNSATGGINLSGKSIELQGANLTAAKDISIVSTNGDSIIDGVKNIFTGKSSVTQINQMSVNKNEIKNEIDRIKNDPNYKSKESSIINEMIQNENILSEMDSDWTSNAGMNYGYCFEFYNECYPYIKRINELSLELKELRKEVRNLEVGISNIDNTINFLNKPTNGFEHVGTNLTSSFGDVNISANQGILIQGSSINAGNKINLGSSGLLTKIRTAEDVSDQVDTGIMISGMMDFYEIGKNTDSNYSMRAFFKPTELYGNNGVNIKAYGENIFTYKVNNVDFIDFSNDIYLNGTKINSINGIVNLSARGDINLEAAQEHSYDRQTNQYRKKSWGGLKKKIITEVKTFNSETAVPVSLLGKSINVQSNDGSINFYSTIFDAPAGEINIQASKALNFYAVQEKTENTTDITKKTSYSKLISFLGSSNTKSASSRIEMSQLPSILTADYVGAKSGWDTRLQGTEFTTLNGAKIEAGVGRNALPDARIILEGIKKTVIDSYTSETKSIAWQKMEGQGSAVETLSLPKFTGPVTPTLSAPGGIIADIPAGNFKNELAKLVQDPQYAYLSDLKVRKDVKWNEVSLAYDSWDYKQQGLTGAGAAIVVLIVTIVTMGAGTAAAAAGAAGGAAAGGTTVGLGASMLGAAGVTTTTVAGVTTVGVSTLGAMANAAVTSLLTQASISAINNGGNLSAVLKDVGSKEALKNLATAVVTAGVLNQLSNAQFMKDLGDMTKSTDFITDIVGRTGQAIVNSTATAAINTGINGGSLSENLESAFLSGFANSIQSSISEQIGLELDIQNKEVIDEILHKVSHIATGCIIGSIQKQCEAGAIGAGVGEIVAGLFNKPAETVSEQEKELFRSKVLATTKLIAGSVAGLVGYDPLFAASAAENAVSNNYLTSQQIKNLDKESKDCKNNSVCLKNVDEKYFGKVVLDANGNIISGFFGANQSTYKNCTTLSCKIENETARQAGMLTLQQTVFYDPAISLKAKNYQDASIIGLYDVPQDKEYIKNIANILSFVEIKCGGTANTNCQSLWINEQNKQKNDSLKILGAAVLAPAVIASGGASISTLRTCLTNPVCTTNVQLAIDGLFVDGAVYGVGAAGLSVATRNKLKEIALNTKSTIAQVVKNEKPVINYVQCTNFTECFVAGTLIETSNGLKPIDKFVGGELIWTRDDITLEYSYRPVIGTSRTDNQPIYELVIEGEMGEIEIIRTTKEHPFWVKNNGWVKTSLLENGMILLDRNNKNLKITSHKLLPIIDTVFNIEVEGTHTYHVGKLGVWVHNACCKAAVEQALRLLKSNGNNPLLKNGSKQLNQIAENIAKQLDDDIIRILNLPQISAAEGGADLMSAYFRADLRPSVLQALYYADNIIKVNGNLKLVFEAPRINGIAGTTDLLVKDSAGKITHAIEFKSLDVVSNTNLVANVKGAINQLRNSQVAQNKIVVIEVRNSNYSSLSSDILTGIQDLKNINPNFKINITFADGISKTW